MEKSCRNIFGRWIGWCDGTVHRSSNRFHSCSISLRCVAILSETVFFTNTCDFSHFKTSKKKLLIWLENNKIGPQAGFGGLYKGFVPGLAGAFLYRGFSFAFYEETLSLQDPLWKKMAAGIGASCLASFIAYPLDTVKYRMIMQSGLEFPNYENSWHCVRRIFFREGLMAFWKGAWANLIRHSANGILLVIYFELLRQRNYVFDDYHFYV